jgi:glucose/arabinose dehydrogenase
MWRSLVVATIAVLLLAGHGPRAGTTERLRLEPVVTNLDNPVFVGHAGDDRLFVVEQPGRIRVLRDRSVGRRPFLDIAERVAFGGERGLLGLAFHPDYRQNGRFFVNYTRRADGATVVAEYRVSPAPDLAAGAERILLFVPQPYPNHNGGMIAFGPDRLLYVGMGDGGSAGDPQDRAQNLDDLLGKMLRIDVDAGTPYGIPADNPLAGAGGRAEIYAWGLRNPWRFSFDRARGDLWAGDVGQNSWEEIDVVRRGRNYGWRVMEGNHCFRVRTGCATEGLEPPVTEYRNGGGRCSVTGGYVYRGRRIAGLAGTYVYGDYCSGEVFGWADGASQVLLSTGLAISSFGEDRDGELLVVDLRGGIYRLVPTP